MTNKTPYKEWQKLDLRVAKILDVKQHPNADKLYLFDVDLGTEKGKRQLVAGLKEFYTEDELKGKSCIVFTNLEPKELRGIKSEGMILAAVSSDRKNVAIINPKKEVKIGSQIILKR